MTHTLTKAITALTLAVASFLPVNAQDAFFVYRNDGQFNAFFNDEIDSIVCSNIDLDSIVHEEFVVQEFHTPDSIYRIPIASIDSVGFQKLPTVYKDNVVSLDHDLWKHIKSVDTTAIHISLTTPKSLIPEAGMKVVSLQTCDFFPYGFSGKIESINETDSCYTLICEWIDPIEVLDRYYCVSKSTDVLARTRAPRSLYTLPTFEKSINRNINTHVTVKDDWNFSIGTNWGISFLLEPEINVIQRFDNDEKYIFGKIITNTTLELTTNIYGEISYEPDLDDFSLSLFNIPTEIPFVSFYGEIGPTFSISGTLGLDMKFSRTYQDVYLFSWSSNNNVRKSPPRKEGKTELIDETNFAASFTGLNIELKTGLYGEVGLCFIKKNRVFDAKVFVKKEWGVKVEANINLPKSVLEREPKKKESKYELIKETNGIESSIYTGTALGVEFETLSGTSIEWGAGAELGYEEKLGSLFPIELFPTFSDVKFSSKARTLECDIKDDLIIPTQVGFKIYDENGNELFKELYTGGDYYNSKSFNHYYITLSDITKLVNRQCTAYPYLTFMGYDIPASPYIEIGIGLFPITDDASGIKYNKAVLNGHIQNEDNLPFNGNVGFLFGTNADPKSFGTKFTSQYNTNAVFSHHLSSLESETTYYYCTFLELGDTCYYGKTVSFTTPEKPEMGEEVDLGLSVNWRGWNVGATKPEECGNYFAWGETSQKDNYTWQTYFENPYDDNDEWIGSATTTDVAGTDKDAATVILGEKWRMPTYEEVKELMEKCSWTWSDYNGVKGYTVESNVAGYEGNFIFLPAAGNYDKTSIKQEGSYGGYWSSTPLDSESKAAAYIFYFYGETIHSTQSSNRYTGRTIRPVTPKEDQ